MQQTERSGRVVADARRTSEFVEGGRHSYCYSSCFRRTIVQALWAGARSMLSDYRPNCVARCSGWRNGVDASSLQHCSGTANDSDSERVWRGKVVTQSLPPRPHGSVRRCALQTEQVSFHWQHTLHRASKARVASLATACGAVVLDLRSDLRSNSALPREKITLRTAPMQHTHFLK